MISFFISSGWAFRARQWDERTFAGEKSGFSTVFCQRVHLKSGFLRSNVLGCRRSCGHTTQSQWCFELIASIFISYSADTHLALRLFVSGQERCKWTFYRVWAAADCMTRVAIIRTLSMETNVIRRRNEKCLQQIIVGELINFRRDVEYPPGDGHCTTKAKHSDW